MFTKKQVIYIRYWNRSTDKTEYFHNYFSKDREIDSTHYLCAWEVLNSDCIDFIPDVNLYIFEKQQLGGNCEKILGMDYSE